MRRIAAAALLGLLLSAPAHAEPFIGGLVKDSDVELAFDFLRDAMSAAFRGREIAPPEALTQRAEAIVGEATRFAVSAAHAAVDVIEREIREAGRAASPRPLPSGI